MIILWACLIIGGLNALAIIIMRRYGVTYASRKTRERMDEWGAGTIRRQERELGFGPDSDIRD